MKLCFPTADDQGLKGRLFGHFGSAPYLTVIDIDTMETECISNQHDHEQHGRCTPVSQLSSRNIQAVICQGMGRNAIATLSKAGIDVFVTQTYSVQEALQAFHEGSLNKMDPNQACQGHS